MANYVLLETISLTQSVSSVTFDNIPQTGYTDLKIVMSVRETRNSNGPGYGYIVLNGTSTNFSAKTFGGYNSGTGDTGGMFTGSTSDNSFTYSLGIDASTSGTFGNGEIYIPNYTSSNYKTITSEGLNISNTSDSSPYNISMFSTLWSNTAAITSISINSSTNTIMPYSTFSLYGLSATGTNPAIAPKASGGNTIDTDGTYWYHAFLSSGIFKPLVNLTCDYLVIAGGGAGGGDRGGGGGAGGYRAGSNFSVTAQSYAITVGAGGTGGAGVGTKGSDSVFSTISSTGGGAGWTSTGTAGSGGSGGGGWGASAAASNDGGAGNQGGYSPVEGYAGGAGEDGDPRRGGGGGGSSAVGVAGASGGTGGAGTSSSITGSAVTRAGGGGGGAVSGAGAGGTGGGGAGANSGSGTDGTLNTGSGGGGGGDVGTPKNGGSGGAGIVIIRYPV